MPEPEIMPAWQSDLLRRIERARAEGRTVTFHENRESAARERRRLRVNAAAYSILSRVMAGEDVTLISGTEEAAVEIMERVRSLITRMPFCPFCTRDRGSERTPCEHCEDL